MAEDADAERAGRGRGLASGDADGIATRVLASWDDFRALAAAADLHRASRLPGWRAQEVCTHLGTWDTEPALDRVLASARAGAVGSIPDADAGNAVVTAAHRDDGREEVLAALDAARTAVAAFLRSPECAELGLAPTQSILGPLPVLGVVSGGCYELAVHGLDLGPTGAPAPPTRLLLAGLGALIDITGALAARAGLAVSVTAQTPDGGWAFTSDRGGWETRPVPPGPVEGIAILGTAADILDVSAGRASAPALLAVRRLRVQDLRGFLTLAPLVEAVPGLPGGGALRGAARTLGAAAGAAGRLPGLGFLRRP